uniref:NADH-ubiquinone oxidoreductase chain 4 n=1 Tax=Neogymnocrinus richeri TaxID=710152 RepID=Q2QJE7_9ECHI|nr:NADH dehydrogenase subunit 4 [Neogymnocrinus richeri]AAY51819.1 NADH dehydrogenase subunit 4 [Neogymnocrinus richeri]
MNFILFGSFGVFISCLICPFNFLWSILIVFGGVLFFISIFFVGGSWCSWSFASFYLGLDSVGMPLVVLSCWLLPLTLLASQGHMSFYSEVQQRLYCALLTSVLISLIVTFSSLELILFYISFEATLIPILVIISRWGSQYDRYQASVYFLFYTLFGSLPFLVSLLSISAFSSSLFLPFFDFSSFFDVVLSSYFSVWWFFTFIVFVVKMPVYGFHLWLPKAHVEATVAGSMLLAAVLLKLGGYGLIRLVNLFGLVNLVSFSDLLLSFCVWGALMTGVICLCQSDLKALIAYSSVGHMSLVAAGIFLGGVVSINGSMILMVAHGLVSSGLFCLANFLYERSGTRTLGLVRGYKFLMVLMGLWWLVSCAANLGLPPLPNLIGELMVVASLGGLDVVLLFISGGATVAGAIYSLLIYQFTQSNKVVNSFFNVLEISFREHVLMFLHLLPLFLILVNPSLVCLYF